MPKRKDLISVSSVFKLIEKTSIQAPVTSYGHGYRDALKDFSQVLEAHVNLAKQIMKAERKKARGRQT